MGSILKAAKLKKNFNTPTPFTIFNDVDLEIHHGETIAILGRSGSGKSTLLHVLGTLEQASEGSLAIAGMPVGYFNKSILRSRHIGFIFQSFHLLDDFTVKENVMMPARILRRSIAKGSHADKQADELLRAVGLSERADFQTKYLSGGEKQRTAIARGLMNNPDLILADEPTGNLDRATAEGIHHLLINFVKERGHSMIVVTHNEDFAALCSKRYLLSDGHLSQLI